MEPVVIPMVTGEVARERASSVRKTTGLWRKIRFVVRGRTFSSGATSLTPRKSHSFPASLIAWRKLRFLIRTGRLFQCDIQRIAAAFEQKMKFLTSRSYLVIILNSTAMFLLAYFFLNGLRFLVTSLSARLSGIGSIIYYWDVDFIIRGNEWTEDSVTVVFASPILLSFTIMVFSLVVYGNMLQESWRVKLFSMWVLVLSVTQFFGEIISGAILMQGFGWVLAFWLFTDTEKMFTVVAAIIALVLSGIGMTRFILFSGSVCVKKITVQNRQPFMFSQFFLPFIIGFSAIVALKQPGITLFELTMLGCLLLLVIPVMIRVRFMNDAFFDEELPAVKPWWLWILAALVLVPAFRLILGHGVNLW